LLSDVTIGLLYADFIFDAVLTVPRGVKVVASYRAMHFSAKRGIEIAYCLSVRLSVCND